MKLVRVLYVLLIGSLANGAFAQEGRSDRLKGELDQEVSRLYNQSGGPELDRVEQERVQVRNIAPPSNIESNPVVVMNGNVGSYVEKRPTTYIEAAPLEESKATRMRKARESMEVETEMRIVEKLESDRMESERERAARIFGDKWEREQEQARSQAKPQEPQYVVLQAPPVTPSPEEAQLEKEDFKQDLRSIVSELKTVEKEEDLVPTDPAPQYYVMFQGGAGDYPGASNVDGVYSIGAAFGADYFTGMLAEISFNLSSFDLDPTNCGNCGYSSSNLIEVKQTNISMVLKYKFSSASRFSPILGTVASFNFRDYSAAYGSSGYSNASSKALDLGLLAGVDISLSERWAVGADIRYMFNLTSRVDRDNNSYAYSNYSYGGNESIEKMSYYLFNINARFMF